MRCRSGSRLRWQFILWLVSAVSITRAQSINNHFEHLSTRNGLSHNSVNCILQDREGFMWFATDDGLNKYDGYSFTVLQPNPDRPQRSFQNNRVITITEDRRGRLWAVTEGGGLHEVDKRTGDVDPHPIRTLQGSRWNLQWAVCDDDAGGLWLSTYEGVAHYDPDRRHFRLYPSPIRDMRIKNVCKDRRGTVWVASSHGLYQLDPRTGLFQRFAGQPRRLIHVDFLYLDKADQLWVSTIGERLYRLDLRQPSPSLMPVSADAPIGQFLFLNALHHDTQGNLWVGSTEGLHRLDPTYRHLVTYRPDPQTADGLSSVAAQAVYHDRNGALWVGTNNGIDKQDLDTRPFDSFQIKPVVGTVNMTENKTNVLARDGRQSYWVTNTHTVFQIDPNRQVVRQVPYDRLGTTPQATNYVVSMLPDQKRGLWFGTLRGLFYHPLDTDRYQHYPARIPAELISRDRQGRIWTGGEGGLAVFSPTSQRYSYIQLIGRDGRPDPSLKLLRSLLVSRPSNQVWLAINGKGISRFDPVSGRFTTYLVRPRHQTDTGVNDVLTLYEDASGRIWAGTNQAGLTCFDPKTGRFRLFTVADGLPSNRIAAISSDEAGHLWLGTDKGLCRFNPATRELRTYTTNDGLPSNEFLAHAVYRQPNQLLFGTLNGFISFDPGRLRNDRQSFPVYLTRFMVQNEHQPLTDSAFTLRHDQNAVSFEFAALNYRLPERNRYAYQLVGIDPGWVSSGTRHFANYTNLPPGTYTFRLRAANSDGVWTAPHTALRLQILPPWWATWWAYGLYALLAVGLVYGYLRFYTSRIRQQQELAFSVQQAEEMRKLEELKSRFFTNITHEFRTPLTLILSPVDALQQELRDTPYAPRLASVGRNARQLLGLINQLMDLSKIDTQSMRVSEARGDLTDFVQQLIDLFRPTTDKNGPQLTFSSTLTGDYLFDNDKLERIINNLITNAIKFTPADGRVTVSLTQQTDGAVVLTVADTGVGIQPEQLAHIFERFYQGDSSSTRQWGGTGVGLALVHELVTLQQGTIGVTSQPNLGTTVRVVLPYRPAAPETETTPIATSLPPNPAVTQETAAPGERLSILLVEDNDELARFIADSLPETYQIRRAVDGVDGLARAQESLPDLIISDVLMPRMNGYALVEALKTGDTTSHIPVMLLTAKASLDSRLEGLSLGADDYLTKPFNVRELQLRVHNLLESRRQLQQRLQAELIRVGPEPTDTPPTNAFLIKFYKQLDSHLSDADYSVEQLANDLAMNRTTLHRRIKSLLNMPATDVIRNYRLKRAAELLRQGHPSAEAAYQVGLNNLSYFAQTFKEVYGQSPSVYGASAQQGNT